MIMTGIQDMVKSLEDPPLADDDSSSEMPELVQRSISVNFVGRIMRIQSLGWLPSVGVY